MRSPLIAVTLLLSVCAAAEAPAVFERGLSPRAVLEQLRAAPANAPSATPKFGRHVRWIPGWKDVALPPGQDVSPYFKLSSTEIVEECTVDPRNGMNCHETFGQSYRREVRIVIKNRPQVPGPEEFRIELEGSRTTLWLQKVYQAYDARFEGGKVVDIVLSPKGKAAPLPPVPNPVPSPSPGRCSTDADCPPGMRCNMAINMCTVEAP